MGIQCPNRRHQNCGPDDEWDERSGSYLTALFYNIVSFKLPKQINFRPRRQNAEVHSLLVGLGILNRLVQISIIGAFAFYFYWFKLYEKVEAVKGSSQAYISSSGLYDEQLKLMDGRNQIGSTFCANTLSSWYHNDACESSGGKDSLAASAFSCEYNITCSYPDYSEAARKGESEMFIHTYLKDTTYRSFPCTQNSNSTCLLDEKLKVQGPLCKCWKTRNQFLMGVDKMNLTISSHKIQQFLQLSHLPVADRMSSGMTTHIVHYVSVLPESHWFYPVSKVVKLSATSKPSVLHSFKGGERITGTIEQWLKWAGINNLDDVNDEALVDHPPAVDIPGSMNQPIYRMSGVQINVHLQWKGSVGPLLRGGSSIECNMIVSSVKGYHSFGSSPIYVDYGVVDPATGLATTEIHDRYLRGIRIVFTHDGWIGQFDSALTLVSLSVCIVYLSSSHLMSKLIFTAMSGMAYLCCCTRMFAFARDSLWLAPLERLSWKHWRPRSSVSSLRLSGVSSWLGTYASSEVELSVSEDVHSEYDGRKSSPRLPGTRTTFPRRESTSPW
mmetsp:Transcript_87011/g.186438  ORF Transcript_87011/g.186438 Transcript_87011/m.186438 type:complete len:555 (+) Transcript_87011:21-1685(+)